MKINKLLLILLSCSLFACQEDGVKLYNENPGLYFAAENANADNTGIVQFNRQDIKLYYDFTLGSIVKKDEWGYPAITYLGDSLSHDTIYINVYRSGKLVKDLNAFNLKQLKIEDDEDNPETVPEPFEIEFFNPYQFQAGKAKTKIKVVFHRPATSGEYMTAIGFDLSNADGFANTVKEASTFTIVGNNHYYRPRGWNDATSIYGAFSEDKYAFYVTVLGKLYEDWHEYMGWDYLPKLKAALKKYNEAYPDTPKNFSF